MEVVEELNYEDDYYQKIALDITQGKIFGTWDLRKSEDGDMVFMAVLLMGEDDRKDLIDRNVTQFYEYMDKALPRSINGYPCFSSLYTLTEYEFQRVSHFLDKYREAIASVVDDD